MLNECFKIDINLGKTKDNFVFKGNKYRISILSDNLIRLEYNENGIFNDYPTILALNRCFSEPKITVKEDNKYLNISNDYFILEYTKEKVFSASKLMPDSNLRISIKDTDNFWYYNHPEVKNLKGSSRDINTKVGNGLFSFDGFSTIDDSKRPVFVSDGSIKKNPSDGIDIYVFVYKNNFSEALKSYFMLTGKSTLLPRYAYGVCWNKNETYNDNSIHELINDFKDNKLPISNILLNNWNGSSTYTFDNTRYTTNMLNDLKNNNIYLGVKLNLNKGFNTTDSVYPTIKSIMKLDKDSVIPINVYNTDVLNIYLNNILDSLNKAGTYYYLIDIDMTDKLKSFILMHYTYNNFNKSEALRSMVYSKNNEIASHRYGVIYTGETEVSWKTLKYLPYYNISSSNMGINYISNDIGGYKNGTEEEELYTRYVQLGTFSSIFRFSSKEGKYYKREPWKWDVKTLNIVNYYTNLRHRLIPYIYNECYYCMEKYDTLIKPLYISNNSIYDEPLYKNEYYFGSEFLVSPITEQKDKIMNRVVHKVYVPTGIWYDFKTGKKFPGDKRYVTFVKDEDYPVFVKSGSIIPMAILDEDNLNDVKPPKDLEIQVFPGISNSYDLYEDDGITNLYKEGYFINTNIDYNYRSDNYTLIIRPIKGKSGIIPDKRNYTIRFRNTKEAEFVKVNIGNYEVPYTTKINENDFIIEVKDVPTTTQLTINCGGKAIEIDAVRLINEDIDSIINDLQIETTLKEEIANIIFSDAEISKKRIKIRKLKRKGLNDLFVKMFIKLLEYISEI